MKNKCHISCRELSQLQHIKIWEKTIGPTVSQIQRTYDKMKIWHLTFICITKMASMFDVFKVIWLSVNSICTRNLAIYDEWLWRYEWSSEITKWRLDDVMVGWSGWKGYCIHSSSGQRYCENLNMIWDIAHSFLRFWKKCPPIDILTRINEKLCIFANGNLTWWRSNESASNWNYLSIAHSPASTKYKIAITKYGSKIIDHADSCL